VKESLLVYEVASFIVTNPPFIWILKEASPTGAFGEYITLIFLVWFVFDTKMFSSISDSHDLPSAGTIGRSVE
jgi:hypothetical protein